MDILLVTAGVVALAEIGDKTQLLALFLAVRLRQPATILSGILVATVANHAIAAWAGATMAGWFGPETLRWALGLSFLVMAVWIMVPDRLDGEPRLVARLGPFLTTTIAFFLVEIGDKTQIATVAFGARYDATMLVTAGTTFGMMLANGPVVLAGDAIGRRIPLAWVRGAAAALFALMGVLTLAGLGSGMNSPAG